MSDVRVVPPGGGEVVGDSPTRRVEILCDDPALHATVSRFGPGQDGADLHVHRHHHDLFYVLEGRLTLRLGPADTAANVGTLVCVPPLVVHGFRNASDQDMRYLNFHAPGSDFANYMRALRDGRKYAYDQHDPPADGGRPITEARVEPGGKIEAAAITVTRVDGSATHDGARLASYYVLEGELELEGERAPAGSFVQADEPHTASGLAFLKIVT